MNKINGRESGERKLKGIALFVAQKEESYDGCSSSCSDTETLTLHTRKFSKFLKKKGKEKHQQGKRYIKKVDNSSNFTCLGCDKQGHIKVECPNQPHKNKAPEKKFGKSTRERNAYIAWEESDTSSSSSLEKEEKENLYLMARDDSLESSVSSSISLIHENYNILLNVLKETHEEANWLALSNNRLKALNNWLENKVSQLEEELMNLKTDFECLEMIHNNCSCDCTKILKCLTVGIVKF